MGRRRGEGGGLHKKCATVFSESRFDNSSGTIVAFSTSFQQSLHLWFFVKFEASKLPNG